MPIYKWTFPAAAVGATVTVQNPAGAVVDTGTVAADTNGQPVFRTTQAEGVYTIESGDSPWAGSFETVGVLDTVASIANTPGAAETAYFVGTATGDTSGDQHALTFVQHPDYPAQDFASAVAGVIVLPGPVVVGMIYRAGITLDFTEATGFSTAMSSPDTDVTIKFSRVDGDGFSGNAGGPYASIPVGTPGELFEIDAVERGLTEGPRCAANEELKINGTVNAFGYDAAGDPVTDGVLTASVVLAITPAPLPVLPA